MEEGGEPIHLGHGGMNHAGDDALIDAHLGEHIRHAEHHLAAVPIDFKIAQVEFLVGPHQQLTGAAQMRRGHGVRSIRHHADNASLGVRLHMQKDLRVMRLEAAFHHFQAGHAVILPAHLFEGIEDGDVEGRHEACLLPQGWAKFNCMSC